jgi:hypothetical protein
LLILSRDADDLSGVEAFYIYSGLNSGKGKPPGGQGRYLYQAGGLEDGEGRKNGGDDDRGGADAGGAV